METDVAILDHHLPGEETSLGLGQSGDLHPDIGAKHLGNTNFWYKLLGTKISYSGTLRDGNCPVVTLEFKTGDSLFRNSKVVQHLNFVTCQG